MRKILKFGLLLILLILLFILYKFLVFNFYYPNLSNPFENYVEITDAAKFNQGEYIYDLMPPVGGCPNMCTGSMVQTTCTPYSERYNKCIFICKGKLTNFCTLNSSVLEKIKFLLF